MNEKLIMKTTSYRPRNPGHDYYGIGTYLITLVVRGRKPLFGRLGNDAAHPEMQLSPLGEAVQQAWKQIPERQRFDACANGSLLVLAPWELDSMEAVNGVPSDSDYSRFHNLNNLAAEICSFNGEAKIFKQ